MQLRGMVRGAVLRRKVIGFILGYIGRKGRVMRRLRGNGREEYVITTRERRSNIMSVVITAKRRSASHT
jgi:hypothetical protein